jgi:leucyl aminopeptidase
MTDASATLISNTTRGVPLLLVTEKSWSGVKRKLPGATGVWADANGFSAKPNQFLTVPGEGNHIAMAIAGVSDGVGADPFAPGRLSRLLPPGTYRFRSDDVEPRLLALGWCLEAYCFDVYGKQASKVAKLVCPEGVDRAEVIRAVNATFVVRDLINTPASDLGPDELEAAVRSVAKAHRAKVRVTRGRSLEKEFPMIHAVGMASPRAPRLIDFSWGNLRAPKVTLVGKGVCFDTGGLDIKPASGMLLMKKDMGGAANVLGLAQMIMAAKLPVRLRVLIPTVENSISGSSFRPGDVLLSRKGLTVEVGNTDAEGRLVLADALALADEESPDLLVDMATLTGAARIALGPDLPPFYTDDETVAASLSDAARHENDPLWRMPFWQPYGRLFESGIADINNSSEGGFAGSITAALFLKRFVERAKAYIHLDIFGWTPAARPARPKGGEAQAMRALFTMIRNRYA